MPINRERLYHDLKAFPRQDNSALLARLDELIAAVAAKSLRSAKVLG